MEQLLGDLLGNEYLHCLYSCSWLPASSANLQKEKKKTWLRCNLAPEFDRHRLLNVYIRVDESAAPPSEESVYSEPSLYSIIPDDVYWTLLAKPSSQNASSSPHPWQEEKYLISRPRGGRCQGHLITIYFPGAWVEAIKEPADRWAILGT